MDWIPSMEQPLDWMNREAGRRWWMQHGRTTVLAGAFALPLVCCSPLYLPPLADQIGFHSPIGILYQALRRIPLLMTEFGFLVWLAWRIDWQPTKRRSVVMLAACVTALIVLPVVCRGLDLATAQLQTNDLGSALKITWILWKPQSLVMAVGQAGRVTMIFLVLRAAVWWRGVALAQSGQQLPPAPSRPKFSIASLLIITALTAMTVAWLPTLLRHFLWADQYDNLIRLTLSLLRAAIGSSVAAVIICVVAWIGPRSIDVLIPALAILCTLLVLVMQLFYQIGLMFPPGFGNPPRFSVLASIPFAIALVAAAELAFAVFRWLGLEVYFRRHRDRRRS